MRTLALAAFLAALGVAPLQAQENSGRSQDSRNSVTSPGIGYSEGVAGRWYGSRRQRTVQASGVAAAAVVLAAAAAASARRR